MIFFFFNFNRKAKKESCLEIPEKAENVKIGQESGNPELSREMLTLNSDFNKNVKSISSIVETLLNNFKSDPQSFENGKVGLLDLC